MDTGHIKSCRIHRNSLFTSSLAGVMRRSGSGGGGVLSGTHNVGWLVLQDQQTFRSRLKNVCDKLTLPH